MALYQIEINNERDLPTEKLLELAMVKMLTSKNQEQQEAGLQINEILNIFKKEVLKNVWIQNSISIR